MATRINITLEGLHRLQARIDRRQIEEEDWPVVGALVSRLLARTEARLARLQAKADQQAAQDNPAEAAPSNEHPPNAEEATEEASESGPPPGAGTTGESA